MKRRALMQSMLAAPLALSAMSGWAAAPDGSLAGRRIAVVGAGVFGAWSAWMLKRAGAEVTLLESWAPGHSRASSGGESRVIRQMYSNPLYVTMARRSLALWREAERAWGERMFDPIGVLFMGQAAGEGFFRRARGAMDKAGGEFRDMPLDEIGRRWPVIRSDGIEQATWEPDSGTLRARDACNRLVREFRAEGGRFRIAQVQPGTIRDGRMQPPRASDGQPVEADAYVFACGPWLPKLFPGVLKSRLKTSRQEVYFFGTPAGDPAFAPGRLPVWADFGERLWYGIPAGDRRGFKIADDTRGPPIDPDGADRRPSEEGIEAARDYLARRFPALADAPLVEARVCQYTNTGDGDFILDRHPEADNVWLLGGGSGHGFKHGPAVGELLARSMAADRAVEPTFRLERFE